MEPILSLGVLATLGGLLGVAICIIILLVAFLISFKKDAANARATEHSAMVSRFDRHINGKKVYFEHEGRKVYALEDDLYLDMRDAPIVRSYSIAPKQVLQDGGLVLQLSEDQVIPDDVASNAAASVSPSPYGSFIP